MRTTHLFGSLLLAAMTFGCAVESGEEDEVLDESTEALTRQTYYVSALAPRTVENGWGPIELDRAVGDQAKGDGGRLSLRGKRYTRGLGVHAKSDVRVVLDGKCSSFRATIGVDDQANPAPSGSGTVVFSVFADGVKLFESGELDKTNAGMSLSADVTGRKELQLVVDSPDDHAWDIADWASARVLCSSKPPPSTPTVVPPQPTASGDLFDDPSFMNDSDLDTLFALFAPGSSVRAISGFVLGYRSRQCTTVTGCAAWSPLPQDTGEAQLGILTEAKLQLYASSANLSAWCTLGGGACQVHGPTHISFEGVHITKEYAIARSAIVREPISAVSYREFQYVLYARTNPNETPQLQVSGPTLTASW